jgi:hypothetical protein
MVINVYSLDENKEGQKILETELQKLQNPQAVLYGSPIRFITFLQ